MKGRSAKHSTEPKLCAWCQTVFERRANEKPAEFKLRATCCHDCARKTASANRKGKRWTEEMKTRNLVLRSCEVCEKQFYAKPCEIKKGAARCCSVRCANAIRPKKPPVELVTFVCEVCGQSFMRPRKASEMFRSRGRSYGRYCSRKCMNPEMTVRAKTKHPTSIESAVYDALNTLRIAHEPQTKIGFNVVDTYVPSLRLVIEVQGDYWHCNPVKYPAGPINEIQRKRIASDKGLATYLRNHGYDLVVVWESDIRKYGAKALLEEALGDKIAA